MCLALVSHREMVAWPVFIAANRDEQFARPSAPPALLRRGRVTVLAPTDLYAGGTWIGANDRGLFAVITNRSDLAGVVPLGARSRGLLVRALLECETLAEARDTLARDRRAPSAPFNLLFGDADRVVRAVRERSDLEIVDCGPGVQAIANHGAPNDRGIREVRRALDAWAAGRARGQDPWELGATLLRLGDGKGADSLWKAGDEHGTVSSTLLAIDGAGAMRCLYAGGPPVTTEYRPFPQPDVEEA